MRVLDGAERDEAILFLHNAATVATSAQCVRSRCGTVIVAVIEFPDGLVGRAIIGVGANRPPDGCMPETCAKDTLPESFKSDRTCCVHAEQTAILDAFRNNPDLVPGSRLYFVRVDENGAPKFSGPPYCTICSKLTQAAGIAEFVLWHPDGVTVYDADEYNRLSFRHADAREAKQRKR